MNLVFVVQGKNIKDAVGPYKNVISEIIAITTKLINNNNVLDLKI